MNKTKKLVIFSLLLAIEIIFCFTPLGSINLFGPIVATLAMIPVSIAAIVLGLNYGMLLGLFMGLFSFIVWTFMPPVPPLAFLFTPFVSNGGYASVIICFVPRIMLGFISAYVFNILKIKNLALKASISGFTGSLMHTLLVLGFIFIFFKNEYATILNQNIFTLLSVTILTNGIPEAIINAISCSGVVKILKSNIS